MAKPPGLVQRGRIWQLRKRVPKDLVPHYGRDEIPISLGTNDYRTALGLFYIEMAKLEAEFAEKRRRRDIFGSAASVTVSPQVLNVTEEEAIAIARALVVEQIGNFNDDERRRSLVPPPTKEAVSDALEEISGELGELSDPSSLEADQRVYLRAIKTLRQNGYDVSDRQRLDPGLLRLVRRALYASGRIELARLKGDYSDNTGDALFAALTDDDLLGVAEARRSKVSLASAIEIFWSRVLSQQPKSRKTEEKYRAIFKVIERFFGSDTAMATISRERCFEFRDAIAKMPPNYSKKKNAPPSSASLNEVIQYAQDNDLPRMSHGTQAIYVALMVRLFTWASHEKMTRDLVVVDIKPRGKRIPKHELRSSFTKQQLSAIFNAPIYRGCKDDQRGFATPGPKIVKRSRYWVPLIALFTGMRLGEILGLRAGNVRTSDEGTPFFDLSKQDGKNTFSRREVPIHSTLLKAGILEFIQKQGETENGALFPDVPLGADGTQTAIFSKRFATFLRACQIKDIDAETCFHMLRHTMRDALDRGHVPEEYIEAIQGWSRSMKTSRSYGDGKEADTLKPWIEKLVLPKVDLSHVVEE